MLEVRTAIYPTTRQAKDTRYFFTFTVTYDIATLSALAGMSSVCCAGGDNV
jgi:hypothetical protein